MKKVLQISGLTKIYDEKKVVDDVTFDIMAGDIVGLVGPNGAGKSTIMKMVLNLIRKDEGTILVDGGNEFAQKIGFASESSSFYDYLSGYENLKLMANLYPDVSDKRIRELVEYVGLSDAIGKKVKKYSTGMKQRLGLARALLNSPELLLLDEPTNGLDPFGMKEVYDILDKMASEQNIAILISSHLLHDIGMICNKIVMINEGKIIFNGNINELGQGLENSFYSFYSKEKQNA